MIVFLNQDTLLFGILRQTLLNYSSKLPVNLSLSIRVLSHKLGLLLCLIGASRASETGYLKVASATFLLVCFICLKESTCKTKKNAFCFTAKALLVLEITNF